MGWIIIYGFAYIFAFTIPNRDMPSIIENDEPARKHRNRAKSNKGSSSKIQPLDGQLIMFISLLLNFFSVNCRRCPPL